MCGFIWDGVKIAQRVVKWIQTKAIRKKKRQEIILLLEEITPLFQKKEFDYENEKLVAEKTRALYDKLKKLEVPAPHPIYLGEGDAAYEFRCKYWLKCVERWYQLLNENKIEEAKNVWFHVGNEMEHWK